jgi:membrane-associated protease RseP (regulator of RpoE activity)
MKIVHSFAFVVAAAVIGLSTMLVPSVATAQPRAGNIFFVFDSAPADQGAERSGGTWIGVESAPIDDALRAQLELEAGQGLLVLEIVPDSPAHKAGIVRHDILLVAGDTKLSQVADLVQAVRKAGSDQIEIEFVHAGKRQKVSLTPAERPTDIRWNMTVVPEHDRLMLRQLEDWMANNQGAGPGRPMAFHLIHPGVVLPGKPGVEAKLPADMSITVTKQGDEPARFVIKKGGQAWELTRDKLGELPADVRQHVQSFLGPLPFTTPLPATAPQGNSAAQAMPLPGQAGPQVLGIDPAQQADVQAMFERQMREANERLERQMRDMNKMLEQLQQQMQQGNPGGDTGRKNL